MGSSSDLITIVNEHTGHYSILAFGYFDCHTLTLLPTGFWNIRVAYLPSDISYASCIACRNALNVVKDDLIARVDELTGLVI